MSDDCDCGNCQCEKSEVPETETPAKKVERLKKSIEELGFKTEETPEGIKISE